MNLDWLTPQLRRELRRQNELIEVRLAWYSTDRWDNAYHICTECPRYWKIYRSNLRVSIEERLLRRGYEMCLDCVSLLDCGHDPVTLEVTNA